MASLVGAKSVKGPEPLRSSSTSAATVRKTSVEKSKLDVRPVSRVSKSVVVLVVVVVVVVLVLVVVVVVVVVDTGGRRTSPRTCRMPFSALMLVCTTGAPLMVTTPPLTLTRRLKPRSVWRRWPSISSLASRRIGTMW